MPWKDKTRKNFMQRKQRAHWKGRYCHKHGGHSEVASGSHCRKCNANYMKQWLHGDVRRALLVHARERAKTQNLPFNITKEDIIVPSHCPVLGIPLSMGEGKKHDGSPSLDKIIPSLGYVKGNIAVVSLKANRIKNDASIAELETVLQWYKAEVKRILS